VRPGAFSVGIDEFMTNEAHAVPFDEFSVKSRMYLDALVIISAKYHKLLTLIDWNDELLVAGVQKALARFPANAFLILLKGCGCRVHKYHCTQLVSPAALTQLEKLNYKNLVFEHVVPKSEYVHLPCVEKARAGELSVEFVADMLKRYLLLATVTKEEDRRLPRDNMPQDWDAVDVFARYRIAGIRLVRNPFFPLEWSPAGDVSYFANDM
jgi:hypothetical protein